MKMILSFFLLFQYSLTVNKKKIILQPTISVQCVNFMVDPYYRIYFRSEGSGFEEAMEFEYKFLNSEYIPTTCTISKDGEEYDDCKLICNMNITTFGIGRRFNVYPDPPIIQNVSFENWEYATKVNFGGDCYKEVDYLFKPSKYHKVLCDKPEKILEIQGEMRNQTNIKTTSSNIILNVKPYLLINDKTQQLECTINFDGTKTIDENAKMSCKIPPNEKEGTFVLSTINDNSGKYKIGIYYTEEPIDFEHCYHSSSSFIQVLGILLIVIFIF